MAAPTYQDFLKSTGGSLGRPNAMGSVDGLYKLQKRWGPAGAGEVAPVPAPTADEVLRASGPRVSATGGIPTSGRSANDPGRMVETVARQNRGDARLQMTAAEFFREGADREQFRADQQSRQQDALKLVTQRLGDGTEVTMTGLGGVAHVNKVEAPVTAEDFANIDLPGGGSATVNQRTGQVVDRAEAPVTGADFEKLTTGDGGAVIYNRRTGQVVDREEAQKPEFSDKDFVSVPIPGGQGTMMVNRRTGAPVTVQKPPVAKAAAKPLLRDIVPPGSPVGTLPVPHVWDQESGTFVPVPVKGQGKDGGGGGGTGGEKGWKAFLK